LEARAIVVGYSNGANIASSLILFHPHYLAAAVLFRAMMPFVPDLIRNLSHGSKADTNSAKMTFVPRRLGSQKKKFARKLQHSNQKEELTL